MEKILVTGAMGQLGTELTPALQNIFGVSNVISTDIMSNEKSALSGPFELLNVIDKDTLVKIIRRHKITQIYHLAAILSANAELNPLQSWDINMKGLSNVLEAAREMHIKKIYWPSSIGIFGQDTPKINTPQFTIMNPSTVYGISKLAGEQWCAYYNQKYGVDVRSLRYPGLISYNTPPGGGTTDYAVDIYYYAIDNRPYICYLNKNTELPMMYIPDAVRATIELMEAERSKLKVITSYNIAGMSFTPEEISLVIQKQINSFKIEYQPDFRQKIADSWPKSIDDTYAQRDWGWTPSYELETMTQDMLTNIMKRRQAAMS